MNGVLPFALIFLCGCGVSPLRGHAVVGRDAYLIFVGNRPGAQADLFGVRAAGGPVFELTYSTVPERAPALSPDGGVVAFLRGRSARDSVPTTVWLMNLLSGAERELPLPPGAPRPERVGWSADGRVLYVAAGALRYRIAIPPRTPGPRAVADAERAVADSALWILLGDRPFGRVVGCGPDLCAETDTGTPTPFARAAHDAVRWGGDSVGYITGGALIVRPVGPGRERRVEWSVVPERPREPTYFGGSTTTP